MPSLADRIRTARELRGLSPEQVAERVIPAQVEDCDEHRSLFATFVRDAEAGVVALYPEDLRDLGTAVGISSIELDTWHAEAGHLPPDLEAALLENPHTWDALREFLAGRVMSVAWYSPRATAEPDDLTALGAKAAR